MIKFFTYTFFIFWILMVLFIFWPLNSEAGEWNEKPIMCSQKDIALKAIRDKGEISIGHATSATKVRDPDEQNGLSPIPAMIPIQIFVNFTTKTYTIAEYHSTYNSVCILAFGDNFQLIGIQQ